MFIYYILMIYEFFYYKIEMNKRKSRRENKKYEN